MSYVHLTTSERVKIETYLELGFSMRKIAQHLGPQPSTISRELKRNPSYNAINAGRLFHEQEPSYSRIYRWIYKGFIKGDLGVLRQKGKRQKPRETRGRFNIGLPISKRPSDVRGRETFGHWELDTVVSGRGQTKACVATFIERKSRFYIALPMVDRSSHSMEHAIRTLYSSFPSGTFQTMTMDRGKEFSCHERIQDSHGYPNVLRGSLFFMATWQQ